MKPTATPAPRLTARCIWRSFRSSGKRHLLLTGGRGAGKSTLLAALALLAGPQPLPGAVTRAERGRAVWLADRLTGEETAIGLFDPALPGPENRMRPLPEALALFGAGVLARAAAAPGRWAVVDEIGYLESGCPAYRCALEELFARKRVLAAVRSQPLDFFQGLRARPDAFCVDLDAPFGAQGCVIMASGQGRRFGGDKLLAELAGRPLLQYALDATAGIFARRVVVTRSQPAAALCRAQGVEVVLHSLPRRSDTVRLGLEALGGGLAGCLFCPADQPLLRRETVAALALAAAAEPGVIWRAGWQGRAGAPVLFPAWAFEALASLPPGAGGSAVLRADPGRVRLLPAADPRELADVDRREDLQALAASL